MEGWVAALAVLSIAVLSAAAAIPYAEAGSVTIDASGLQKGYIPNQQLSGNIYVYYNTYIPRTSEIALYINGNRFSSTPLRNYTFDPGYYGFAPKAFTYRINAQGTSTWFEYPNQSFRYKASASGTCGGIYCFNYSSPTDYCNCPADCQNSSPTQKYPCSWSVGMTEPSAANTSADKAVNFIFDASRTITLDTFITMNGDTVWSDSGNSGVGANSKVYISMREACGSEGYRGKLVASDGWRRMTLNSLTSPSGITANYVEQTIDPFDNSSLSEPVRGLFITGNRPGGIYKDGVYQQFSASSGVQWDGKTGYVRVYNYNPSSTYEIAYLPPNGPRVCAYTTEKNQALQQWTASSQPAYGSCSYATPFSYTHTQQDLNNRISLPACTQGGCTQAISSYSAEKLTGSPDVFFSFDSATKTARAYTTAADLSSTYTMNLNIADFGAPKAPQTSGNATIELALMNGSSVMNSTRLTISTCADSDGDGFCSIQEGGSDCNDADAEVHPGANETCNGLDDNCNGKVDEGFSIAGKVLGSQCNNYKGSGCSGVWVCTPDGLNVTCKSPRLPGEIREICANQIDDDCDGEIDEAGCGCVLGATIGCGSDVGECKAGFRLCMPGGNWSDCRNSKDGAQESCNGKDDNCDGITDNLGGGNSAEATKCGCYGGALPKPETCNGIDDDCNGKVDDGITCCSAGETRPCGLGIGSCVQGIESCQNRQWSGNCMGGIQPGNPRVDANCNEIGGCGSGEITEACLCGSLAYSSGFCCGGIHKDSGCSGIDTGMWMMIAGGILILIIMAWALIIKGIK